MVTLNSDELFQQAMRLPVEQRAELIARLFDTLDDSAHARTDLSAEWIEECHRRIAESEAGIPGIPLPKILQELDRRRDERASS